VTRVEIKAIDPPKSVKDAMEKQMRAEREKRAAVLTAEGQRQSQILTAEGDRQSKILRAEGDKQAAILRAEGEAQAITQVFGSIHRNDPDPKLLAYQYLQTLPQLANGAGNTFWVIPSEVTTALKAVTSAFGGQATEPGASPAGAPAPGAPAPGAAAPGKAPQAVEQAAAESIPRQPGPAEIAVQQAEIEVQQAEIAAQQAESTVQPTMQTELATDPEEALPASITPPGSPNGSAPSSGEDS
jgi:hypothetical protein